MVLLGVLLVEAQASGAVELHRSSGAVAALGGDTRRCGQLGDPLVVEMPGGADDDVLPGVASSVVGVDLGDRDRGDHLRLAQNAAAERVLAEDCVGEEVVDAVLRFVLIHRDLLQHHVALGVDLRIGRRQQHLGEQVEDLLGVLIEEAGVQMGRLLAGRRVDRGAEPVKALGDLDRRVALGPLEQQVLQEVGDPRLGGGLVAGAGSHPESERYGANRGNLLGHYPDARAHRAEIRGAQCLAAPLALALAPAAVAASAAPLAIAAVAP